MPRSNLPSKVEDQISSAPDTRTTTEILAGLRTGQPSADSEFFDKYWRRVYALARSRLGARVGPHGTSATDIANEAILAGMMILKRLDTADLNNSDRGWPLLATIVTKRCCTVFRSRRSRLIQEAGDSAGNQRNPIDDLIASSPEVDTESICAQLDFAREELQRTSDALRRIATEKRKRWEEIIWHRYGISADGNDNPEQQQEVVQLYSEITFDIKKEEDEKRYFGNPSIREIARRVELSDARIRHYLAKIKAHVKTHLVAGNE
jgi:RNA polymerase sigma factor (sigma-70 family)